MIFVRYPSSKTLQIVLVWTVNVPLGGHMPNLISVGEREVREYMPRMIDEAK